MTFAIPEKAIKIQFEYGKTKGYFHIWPTTRGTWQWDAFGQSGEEDTQNRAIERARLWIQGLN